MSVIVLGMEMPKEATFAAIFPPDDEHDYCYIRVIEGKGKGGDYEIIPLPEKHGRLIDADELEDVFYRFHSQSAGYVQDAETIVEAEGKE